MIIHHVSFGVSKPGRVAQVLAELTGATAMRAPTPPFPHGAWFVLAGDDRGSFLEILPATAVFDPDAPLGLNHRPATFAPGSSHMLISTIKSSGEIEGDCQARRLALAGSRDRVLQDREGLDRRDRAGRTLRRRRGAAIYRCLRRIGDGNAGKQAAGLGNDTWQRSGGETAAAGAGRGARQPGLRKGARRTCLLPAIVLKPSEEYLR